MSGTATLNPSYNFFTLKDVQPKQAKPGRETQPGL